MHTPIFALLASVAFAAGPSGLQRLVPPVSRDERNSAIERLVAAGSIGNITVQTLYGAVTGLTFNKSTQYLGVPFATPPIGDLRWKSPVSPRPWGAYDATRYRDICVQTDPAVWGLLSPGESEDCLYLVRVAGRSDLSRAGVSRPLRQPFRTSTFLAPTTHRPQEGFL